MRDFFEVASGNLSTSSWTIAHRFLIGSRLFPDYVPLSQKKAKLEPHHSWVLFAVWAGALSCWKILLEHVLQQFSAQNIQILLHVPVDSGVGCTMASCRQSSSELSGWVTFPPKFLAITILAVLERTDGLLQTCSPLIPLFCSDATSFEWSWLGCAVPDTAPSELNLLPACILMAKLRSVLPHLSDIAFRWDWHLKILGQYFCSQSAPLEIFLAKAWTLHWTCA